MPIPSSIAFFGDEITTGRALEPDLAGVRTKHPGEDAHQRRLAGTVLAEQAVHLAAPKLIDMRSFASTPGKAFVIPPSSTAGCARPSSAVVVGLPVVIAMW